MTNFFLLALDAARYHRANWIFLAGLSTVALVIVGAGCVLLFAKQKTKDGAEPNAAVVKITRIVGLLCVCGGIGMLVYTWCFHPVAWF
jgi:hypothetical protein